MRKRERREFDLLLALERGVQIGALVAFVVVILGFWGW